MGTRHLTIVVDRGEYRISQYGQFDGYPEGAGLVVYDFITKEYDPDLFQRALSKTVELNHTEVESLYEGIADRDFKKAYPTLHRDTGAGVLSFIQEKADDDSTLTIPISPSLAFAGRSLFCEWAYLLDLDNRVLEVYSGFNKEPLDPTDRFVGMTDASSEYHPIRKLTSYGFDELSQITEREFTENLEALNRAYRRS